MDNFSITNLFANLQDRIEFLIPGSFVKEHWKLSGKMYRSKLPSVQAAGSDKFNSICTLQSSQNVDVAHYLINKEIFKADPLLDSIIGKLNLMYSVRQSYSMEGCSWKSQNSEILIKCSTIYSGSEPVNILIQIITSNNDDADDEDEDEIFEKVFPDFNKMNENDKVRIEEQSGNFDDDDIKNYFDIIVKTVKLNL